MRDEISAALDELGFGTRPPDEAVQALAELARNGDRPARSMLTELGAAAQRALEDRGVPNAARLVQEAIAEPRPLFDPASVRFGRYLASDPPPRRWLLRAGDDGVFPLDVVGLLAAMGGAGKSNLALQLGFSVAAGIPFLGMQVGEPGSFLYLAAEDDDAELHRRGRTLLTHYEGLARLVGEPFPRALVAERLYIASRVAEDNLLTRAGHDGEVRHTHLVRRMIATAQQIPDLRAIVVDPISRSRGGRANTEEDATRFVEALEVIRRETGATVLGLHHISQTGIREGGGQEIVRGSTALVDGVRWVATLQRLRRDQAKDYGLQEDEASRYLRFEIPKSNYSPPFSGMWLRREAGGVLVPAALEKTSTADADLKAQREYVVIVGRIQQLLKEKGSLTRYAIRKKYCGVLGVLGAGDQTVRSVIERGLREGDLDELDGGLLVPGGES
ncbi:MAG: AAA family ATPase [Gemmatimonadota bacterium]